MTKLNFNITMKKVSTFLFLMVFTIGSFVYGQDAKKMMKEADKMIKSYTADLANTDIQISDIMGKIDAAFQDESYASEPKNHVKKAEIIQKIIDAENIQYGLNPSYEFKAANASIAAFEAYKKANMMGETKKSLNGISNLEASLGNSAAYFYNRKQYAEAFKNFEYTLAAKDLLSSAGKPSRLDADSTFTDQVLFTAVSGYYSETPEIARPYFEKLKGMGSTDPIIYDALYNLTKDANPEEAIKFLSEGREKNPNDTGILFAEINHYLQAGELTTLISKLEAAIEAEPDNVSVYTTLGSVYDQLTQQAYTDKNTAQAEEYFAKAKDNFEIAQSKDPNNFDAAYSVGALYYNKAAGMVEELNALGADFSPAGIKKYDAKKAEMDDLFKEALPFFQKAEALNGKDMNTLIALKEIHARLNDIVKSNEYKAKIEGM